MTFYPQFRSYNWEKTQSNIHAKKASDVERALNKTGSRTLEDFQALVSPAAESYLENMAQLSHQITQKRFGKTVQLYIPLYLSNRCQNLCLYCGFNAGNPIERITLNQEQVLKEVEVIKAMGFDHVLLVTGESTKADINYLENMVSLVRPYFSSISLEVQPLNEEDYRRLIQAGVHAVYIYQETYGPLYKKYHLKGSKVDIEKRLNTPDRLGKAGVHKIGLGCLLGLDDWRTDSWFVAAHLAYLEKAYWKTRFTISFPRIRPATGDFAPPVEMSDAQLVQLICAYRLFNENVELSISTRESVSFRNNIFQIGVTALSAASKTNPGGYYSFPESTDQFTIDDSRSAAEFAELISVKGYEPLWKDWFHL